MMSQPQPESQRQLSNADRIATDLANLHGYEGCFTINDVVESMPQCYDRYLQIKIKILAALKEGSDKTDILNRLLESDDSWINTAICRQFLLEEAFRAEKEEAEEEDLKFSIETAKEIDELNPDQIQKIETVLCRLFLLEEAFRAEKEEEAAEALKLLEQNPDQIQKIVHLMDGRLGYTRMDRLFEARHTPEHKRGFIQSFASIHTDWWKVNSRHPDKFKHPLSPLVKECLRQRVPKVETERRRDKVFPTDFESTRSVETRERLPIGVPHDKATAIQGELPSLETDTVLVPALPLEVYHADEKGRGGQGAGTGAPGDEMVWFNSIVSVPREHRLYTTGVKIAPTLREVLKYRYPNGWRRSEQLPLLIEDFYRIHNKRVVWKRVAINLVQVYKAPTMTTQLDDSLEIVIRFPEGFKGQNGPMIDMEKQNQRGLRSATEWRAGLRLAYFWDNHKSPVGNGRYANIYATRNKVLRNSEDYLTYPTGERILSGDVVRQRDGGWHVKNGKKPQKAWYHPWATVIGEERNPECDKIPPLTNEELIHLCYDDSDLDPTTTRKRLFDAKQTLYKMQDRGDIVIEKDVICQKRGIKGWRIIQARPKKAELESR